METQQRSSVTDVGLLGLTSVLASSLPTTLLTAQAPERYAVDAVFTRRPETEEVALITGEETRGYLSQHGYPDTVLTIADRRLRIANTNLEELHDGLAAVVAERLTTISADIHARHDAAVTQYREAAEQEQQRATAVALLAGAVSFGSTPQGSEPEPVPLRDESPDAD